MKKRLFKLVLALTALFLLTSCGGDKSETTQEQTTNENTEATESNEETKKSDETVKVTIGATALPHAEILEFIAPALLEDGIELNIVEFGDYTLINKALNEGDLDANFFQHIPYLESYVESTKEDLLWVAKTHIEPMGIYSSTLKSLEELKDGAVIGIPNDETNEARALLLLQSNGLIKLKDGADFKATPIDIAENTKNFKFVELDAATLPSALGETDISVINTNYALEAKLDPYKDAIAIEEKDSPYANILVVRGEDEKNENILKVIKALQTEEVKTFLETQYKGAVVPSF